MIKKIFVLAGLVFFCLNVQTVSAQTTSEVVYRAQLMEIISDLLIQIEELQKQLDAQNNRSLDIDLSTDEPFESFLLEDESFVEARYGLSSDKDVVGISDRQHREYFLRLFELVPNKYGDYINELIVFTDRGTDIDAFVETIPPYKIDTWRLGISESMFEFQVDSDDITELFVHEIAHIISYDSIRGVSEPAIASCHDYFEEYGCAPKSSFFTAFVDRFWEDSDLDQLIDSDDESIWNSSELRRGFVSEYAGTNPQEDFAESFTFFVSEPKSTGYLIKDKKTRFFYNYNELVDLKEEILEN